MSDSIFLQFLQCLCIKRDTHIIHAEAGIKVRNKTQTHALSSEQTFETIHYDSLVRFMHWVPTKNRL